jgi:hypothetical protein
MYPDRWDIGQCPDTYPLINGAPGPMDGTLCRDKRQGFFPCALPSSKSEGTRHNVMMIPESDIGTRATQQRDEPAI